MGRINRYIERILMDEYPIGDGCDREVYKMKKGKVLKIDREDGQEEDNLGRKQSLVERQGYYLLKKYYPDFTKRYIANFIFFGKTENRRFSIVEELRSYSKVTDDLYHSQLNYLIQKEIFFDEIEKKFKVVKAKENSFVCENDGLAIVQKNIYFKEDELPKELKKCLKNKDKAKKIAEKKERVLKKIENKFPHEIEDMHFDNFGLDSKGNIKLLDLGIININYLMRKIEKEFNIPISKLKDEIRVL